MEYFKGFRHLFCYRSHNYYRITSFCYFVVFVAKRGIQDELSK